MARCVHNVDAYIFEFDRGGLGQDGEAAFAFDGPGIHDPLGDILMLAECAGLMKHGIHKGGLAVVHVCNDRDVAHILASFGGRFSFGSSGHLQRLADRRETRQVVVACFRGGRHARWIRFSVPESIIVSRALENRLASSYNGGVVIYWRGGDR